MGIRHSLNYQQLHHFEFFAEFLPRPRYIEVITHIITRHQSAVTRLFLLSGIVFDRFVCLFVCLYLSLLLC